MVVPVRYEDAIMIVVDRNAIRKLELAWLVALLAELGHERGAIIAIAITREYLHSTVGSINDEQETSTMVERQAGRKRELAISIAVLLGTDRELDSRVVIKRIERILHPLRRGRDVCVCLVCVRVSARAAASNNQGAGLLDSSTDLLSRAGADHTVSRWISSSTA